MHFINIPNCQQCGAAFGKRAAVRHYLPTGSPIVVCLDCRDSLKRVDDRLKADRDRGIIDVTTSPAKNN